MGKKRERDDDEERGARALDEAQEQLAQALELIEEEADDSTEEVGPSAMQCGRRLHRSLSELHSSQRLHQYRYR
jgi:hypothetical protein